MPDSIQGVLNAPQHDLPWLKQALQWAVELELFTIPPYLTALWSIRDESHAVAATIREVVYEEMEHLATVCNLLAALGATPRLASPAAAPKYPGPMPGGVKPELTIRLSRLSSESLRAFMELEAPEFPLGLEAVETFPRIGAFYSAIQDALERVQPPLSMDRQLAGPGTKSVGASVAKAIAAIEKIKSQGEGTTQTAADGDDEDLAHYYRFAEVQHGQKLVKSPHDGKWRYAGERIEFPAVWPVAVVPKGGYVQSAVSPEVWQGLTQFDAAFSRLLRLLESAWEHNRPADLGESIDVMYSLRDLALPLMQTPIPGSAENYGPCFRIV